MKYSLYLSLRCGKMAEELLSLKWNNHQAHFVDILTFLREQVIRHSLWTITNVGCVQHLDQAQAERIVFAMHIN